MRVPKSCRRVWRTTLLLLCFAASLPALPALDCASVDSRANLLPSLEYWRTPRRGLDPVALQAPGSNADFRPVAPLGNNFGFVDDVIWLRFSLSNSGVESRQVFLELAYPAMDSISLHRPSASGYQAETMGDLLPFSSRAVLNRNFVFVLDVPPGDGGVYYLRAETEGTFAVPLTIWNPRAFYNVDHAVQLLYGLFFGITLIMLVNSAFLFALTRDFTHVAYIAFIAGIGMIILVFKGFAFEMLWPGSPFLANHTIPFTFAFTCLGGAWFTMLFLDTRRRWPRIHRVLLSFVALSAVLLPLVFILPNRTALLLSSAVALALILVLLASGVLGLKQCYRPARFYALGWSAFLIGSLLLALRGFGLLDISFFTDYGIEVGSAIQMVLLSFSLADRIAVAQQEKDAVQRKALEEHRRQAASFARFVPRQFLEFLGRPDITEVELGDHTQRYMTVLFSDIRTFTTLSEQMSSDESFRFLNSYLKRVGPIVRRERGFIDKYIGDAVMALFPNCPDDAWQAAVEMQKELVIYNRQRATLGYAPIRIGIGLHCGVMTLGTIGEEGRLETTVISDTVNVASRLESLEKTYGAGILASQDFIEALKPETTIHARFLDRVQVKGKKRHVIVYEVLDALDEDLRTLKERNAPLLRDARTLRDQGRTDEARRRLGQAELPDLDLPVRAILERLDALCDADGN